MHALFSPKTLVSVMKKQWIPSLVPHSFGLRQWVERWLLTCVLSVLPRRSHEDAMWEGCGTTLMKLGVALSLENSMHSMTHSLM